MSVRSISTTARAGNVLVLLDLYASGFASSTASPTIPMLTSRTMHALYAVSVIVYCLDSALNWVHLHFVLHGLLSSFPLRFWFALLLVIAAVAGAMLILLLVMLCVENAFAHRLDITVHKSGLSVIVEAFLEWMYGFNNFRIAFLFMMLHDAPITLANFFLLSACRCAGPNVHSWPFVLSSVAILVSLCWRLVILQFAYSRLIFGHSRSASSNSALPSGNQSFRNHFANMDGPTSTGSSQGTRLDERCPLRWSSGIVYGDHRPVAGKSSSGCVGGAEKTLYLEEAVGDEKRSLGQCCGFWLSWMFLKGFDLLCAISRRVLCATLSLLGFVACGAVCCLPCLHHYTCARHSFGHRHKCAKSFVRHCTLCFHYSIFAFSFGFTLLLIVLNLILITSVQLIGPNQWAPEISRLCISVDPHHRIVRPLFLPDQSLFSPSRLQQIDAFGQPLLIVQCKPIWDRLPQPRGILDQWAPGMHRLNPGPWQARFPLGNGSVLAVSTHFVSNHSLQQSPSHTLFYDLALLRFGADNSSRTTECTPRQFSKWLFTNVRNQLWFPYFWACSPTIYIRKEALIDCRDLTRRRNNKARREQT